MFGIFPDKHRGEVQLGKVLQASFQQCCACSESSVRALVEGSLWSLPASRLCLPAVCPAGGYCTALSPGVIIVPSPGFAVGVKWECRLQRCLPIVHSQGPLAIAVPLTPPPLLLFNQLPSWQVTEPLRTVGSGTLLDHWFGRQLGGYLETELLIQTLGPSPKINSISCCPLLSLRK